MNALESLYATEGGRSLRRMHIDTEILAEDEVQGNQTYHNEISLHTPPHTAALYFCSAHMPTAWTSCSDLLTEYITQFYNRTLHREQGVNETSPWPAQAWLPKAYFPSTAEHPPLALLVRERIDDNRVTVRGWREDVYNLLHFPKIEQEENSNVALVGGDLHQALHGCTADPALAKAASDALPSTRHGENKLLHAGGADSSTRQEAQVVSDGSVSASAAPVRVLHMIVHQNCTNTTHTSALLAGLEGMRNSSQWGLDVHVVVATALNCSVDVHGALRNASSLGGFSVHVAALPAPQVRDGSMHDFAWAARQLLVDTAARDVSPEGGSPLPEEHSAWASLRFDVYSFWDVRYVPDARNVRHFWEMSTEGDLPANWIPGFMSWTRTCHSRSAYPSAVGSGSTRGSAFATSFVSRSGFPSLHKSKYCARTLDWGSLSHNDAYRVYEHGGRRHLVFFNPMQGGFMATAGHMRTALQRQCLQSQERRHWAHDSATVAYTQLYYACGMMKVVPLSCVRGFGVRRLGLDVRVALEPTEDRGYMTDRLLQSWALECTNGSAQVPPVERETWLPYEQDHTLYYLEEEDDELEEDVLMQNMTQSNAAMFRTPTGQSKLHEVLSERTATGQAVQPPVEGTDEVGFSDSSAAHARTQNTQADLRRRAEQRLTGRPGKSGTAPIADADAAATLPAAGSAASDPESIGYISPEDLAVKPVGGEGGPVVPPGGDFDPSDLPEMQEEEVEEEEEEELHGSGGGAGGGSLTEALLEELLDGIGEEEDWQNIG